MKKIIATMLLFISFCFFITCTLPTGYVHTYRKVEYSELDQYLQELVKKDEKAKGQRVHYIDLIGVKAEDLKGTVATNSCSALGVKLKSVNSVLVGIKLPNRIEGLISMEACFLGCESVVDLANIPEGVTSLEACFKGCLLLKELPPMPKTIENMEACFFGCAKLVKGQAIPEKVMNLRQCFAFCYSLKSVNFKCRIPVDLENYQCMFDSCNALSEKSISVKSADFSECQKDVKVKEMFVLNSGDLEYESQLQAAKACFTTNK